MDVQHLVGRSNESAVLASCLSGSSSGGRSAALVRGRPGFGKTYLVTHFAVAAQRHGVLVSRCSLTNGDRTKPYSLWIRVLEDLVISLERNPSYADLASSLRGTNIHALEHIVPHLVGRNPTRVLPAGLRTGIAHEILLLFARIAERSRILVIVDNLQSADESSLVVLRDICSSVRLQKNLTLCITVREPFDTRNPNLTAAISALVNDLEAHQISLGPFTHGDIAAYLASCGADTSDELVKEVHRVTEGNPLFVSRFGAIDAQGCHDLADQIDSATAENVEERILEYFRLRLTELDETTRTVLGAATVLDGEFTPEELSAATGENIERASLETSFRDAVVHSFLDEEPTKTTGQRRYRFYHELVRRAVIRSTDANVLQEAHRRMAAYIQTRTPPAPAPGKRGSLGDVLARGKHLARMGEHLLRSGHPDSVSTGIDLLLQAGEHFLSGGANEDARSVFSRISVEHADALRPRDQARVDYGLGKTLLLEGRRFEAFTYLRSALEHYAALGDTKQLVEVALQPVMVEPGHAPFVDLLQRAATVLPDGDPSAIRVAVYHAGALALVTGDYERSLKILRANVGTAALDAASPTDGIRARAFLAYLYVRLSLFHQAHTVLKQVKGQLKANSDPVTERIVGSTEYEIARISGDLDRARNVLRRRLDTDEAIGDRWLLADSFFSLGRLSLKEGDWSLARRYLSQALNNRPEHSLIRANLVMLECALGRYETAEEVLQLLVDRADDQEPGPVPVFVAAASALVTTALFSGATDATITEKRLHKALRLVRRARGSSQEHPFIAARRVVLSAVIAYYLRRRDECRKLLAELDRVQHYNTIDPGHMERARGLLHYLNGSRTQGEAALRRAAILFRKSDDLPRTVLVESEYAVELCATDPADAGPAVESLLSTCRQHGMNGVSDRLRRTTSCTPAVRPHAERPTGSGNSGIRILTTREKQVFDLLAAGMSDKEIAAHLCISGHTASNHVRHILTKSGSSNRTQAVARLLQQNGE